MSKLYKGQVLPVYAELTQVSVVSNCREQSLKPEYSFARYLFLFSLGSFNADIMARLLDTHYLTGFLMLRIFMVSLVLICSGCARLDHFQIGDIDQSQGRLTPISIKVSNVGFDVAATAGIASELANSDSAQQDLGDLSAVLALINMGPRTGNPVYSDRYAENILQQLHAQCPSGKITAIRNVREATSFGPVSGEIVRIDADCIL